MLRVLLLQRRVALRGLGVQRGCVLLPQLLPRQLLGLLHQLQPLARMAQQFVDLSQAGCRALELANDELGLALSTIEIDYLWRFYQSIERNPSVAELMMFAQVNSEHCRHKIFNGTFVIDGQEMPSSLFKLIKKTGLKFLFLMA